MDAIKVHITHLYDASAERINSRKGKGGAVLPTRPGLGIYLRKLRGVGGGREVHASTRELPVLSATLSEHVGCVDHVFRVREEEINESLDNGYYGHRVRHAEVKKSDVLTSEIKSYALCLRVRHPGLNMGESVSGDALYVQGGL